MKKHFKNLFFIITALIFLIFMVVYPNPCHSGALKGLILCGRVIIPALFPFTVCVLVLMRLNVSKYLSFLEKITKPIFNLSANQFAVFLLSLIGGYPVGAQLIEELSSSGEIDKKTARTMLCFCVNAGPAFIVLAVGDGILGSKSAGYCLLASHVAASFILTLLLRKSLHCNQKPKITRKPDKSLSEIFVSATADASAAMLNICSYVILFSTVNAYLLQYPKLEPLVMLFEVTNGTALTNNIYIISFLLGFSGLSILLQVISVSKTNGVNLPLFISFKTLHGIISATLTYILLKLFPVHIDTISNNMNFSPTVFYSSAALAVSLLIMVILLIFSIFGENQGGKLREDMI